MKKKRIIYRVIFISTSLIISFILFCFFLVELSNDSSVYRNIEKTPHNKVGLLLGTSKYLKNGEINPFFKARIQAAFLLYQADKIDYILASGDNKTKNYNEPERMRKELVALGIPEKKIILDYAGFRTLDSVIRSKKIFGQNSITIISQNFHNRRALYIASYHHINAIAFNAKGLPIKKGLSIYIREVFARVKMIIDLYLLNKKPHFLGKPIPIP